MEMMIQYLQASMIMLITQQINYIQDYIMTSIFAFRLEVFCSPWL